MSQRFLPFVSYPHHELDPGMDTFRNEGEARLRKIRPLLRISTKTPGLENLLMPHHASSLPALLGEPCNGPPDQATLTERQGMLDSLLASSSDKKPSIALLTPTVRTLTVAETDELDEVAAQACVPIKHQDLVAIPGDLPVRKPKPRVVVRWPKGSLGKSRNGALLTVEYMGPGRVRYTAESATGVKYENMYACDIPESMIDQFFAPIESNGPLASPGPSIRIPSAEGELPEELQMYLASFAQCRLRLHVLASASSPATRSLAFDNMKVTWKTAGVGTAKRSSMCVKAYLHPSSTTCFCGAHLMPPIEKRYSGVRFTGKQYAVLNMEMCGSCLSPENDMGCPTHGAKCKRNREFAPGVCCSNYNITVACNHENVGEWKPYGLWLPVNNLETCDWEEITMLLGLVSEYSRASQGLFGPSAPTDAKEKLKTIVNAVHNELEKRVARFEVHAMHAKRPSDADLVKSDMLALHCLREGGIGQAKLTGSQRAPKLVRPDGPELNGAEKALSKSHHWLFPRAGQSIVKRQISDASCSTAAPPSDQPLSPDDESAISDPLPKRPCVPDNPNYDYEGMTEFLDVAGLASALRQLAELMAAPNLPQRQRDRGLHFQQFLTVCDVEYGSEVDGPLGLPARPLVCKYRARNDGGRLYPTGMPKAPGWNKGEARSVCIQAAPREIRPFMCCRWAHDFDMKNAQPEMLRQMPRRLSWVDGRTPPTLVELERWCADRPEYIEHVANLHTLPTDEERHYEYRKDTVKELMIRLMFGGQYESWIKDICKEFGRVVANEPRSERVVHLAAELAQLRRDVFESRQWAEFVERDRARLVKEGKKKDADAVDRAVFARIAQKTENEVLTVMRTFLKERGWTTLTLCFDGLMVKHRPERTLDLAAMNARILKDTGYELEIVEKPLFHQVFPVLTLDRA